MKRWKMSLQLLLMFSICICMLTGLATAQEEQKEMAVFFSTEEEFITRGTKPADGNPIISDGDLLHSSGNVYMRHYQLLEKFQVKNDLGLDAADVFDARQRFVAFSTELDHPHGAFTAGDLLTTTGAVIPNAALLASFNIPRGLNLGLDAVQLIGERNQLIKFFDLVMERGRDYWLEEPKRLSGYLKEFGIDIWFSTEGTAPFPRRPKFLDGDLLSAASGTIIFRNRNALPNTVPAGIPVRGVDFGMDAVALQTREDRENRKYIFYSTEILFEGRPSFTDGDVLRSGNGVVLHNGTLIKHFKPKAGFLGLDALSLPKGNIPLRPQITHFNEVHVDKINASGLAYITAEPFGQPFGQWIQIEGVIPDDVDEFRVVYCKASDWPCSAAATDGIEVNAAQDWHLSADDGSGGCSGDRHWFSDADGWYNAADYRTLRNCAPDLPLTMWNSAAAPDPEGLYIVWLQFKRGAVISRELANHYIQLDNTPPKNLAVAPKSGSICGEFRPGDMPMTIKAHFDDAHFWRYRLVLSGGDPPGSKDYGYINYYDDPTDNAGPTGTGAGMVELHDVNINDLPIASIDDCAYVVHLHVWDRTIRGYWFDAPNDDRYIWNHGWHSGALFTFDYTP